MSQILGLRCYCYLDVLFEASYYTHYVESSLQHVNINWCKNKLVKIPI